MTPLTRSHSEAGCRCAACACACRVGGERQRGLLAHVETQATEVQGLQTQSSAGPTHGGCHVAIEGGAGGVQRQQQRRHLRGGQGPAAISTELRRRLELTTHCCATPRHPNAPHRRELLHLGSLPGRSPQPDGMITCAMHVLARSPGLDPARRTHAVHFVLRARLSTGQHAQKQ